MYKKKTNERFILVCQCWTQTNEGQTPVSDGYSLHISINDINDSINNTLKQTLNEVVYQRKDEPYEVEVSKTIFAKIKKSGAIRSLGNPPVPGIMLRALR